MGGKRTHTLYTTLADSRTTVRDDVFFFRVDHYGCRNDKQTHTHMYTLAHKTDNRYKRHTMRSRTVHVHCFLFPIFR